MWEGIGSIYLEWYDMDRTMNRIIFFWNHLSLEAQHYISAGEQIRTEIPSGRKIEQSGAFVMRSYLQRDGKKEKEGMRRESPQLRYIDTAMFLAGKQKWYSETPGIAPPNNEGRKSAATEGMEGGRKPGTNMRDSEISNATPHMPTKTSRPRGLKVEKRIQIEKAEALQFVGEFQK